MRERKSWKDQGMQRNFFWTRILGSQEGGDFRDGSAQNLAREALGDLKIAGDFLDKPGTRQFLDLAHRERHVCAPGPKCSPGSTARRLEFFSKVFEAARLAGNQSHDEFQKPGGLGPEIKFRGQLVIEIG
jgi:hypothetical protein